MNVLTLLLTLLWIAALAVVAVGGSVLFAANLAVAVSTPTWSNTYRRALVAGLWGSAATVATVLIVRALS